MYTLLSGFYKYLTMKDEYNVLILGLDNAGKSTMLEKAKSQFTLDYKGIVVSKLCGYQKAQLFRMIGP